ncbi:urease accessory protein UreH domain-containing protein [Falsiroseomonas selenitidurans]|uniref:Sulfite exporter TauE/SafE family protein n=1 Tax=Falsiroseomonas selenitidurans TaxID=2716335 RepID=A0ABX1E3J4_9PROT|nr:sulfite exporter TauE/SafE family protein [Falsiroseomonas selenitidurans]NKC29530.1 sulfite exporter TauE/SafE family protein [Falsiroseomonas selenitidurans]
MLANCLHDLTALGPDGLGAMMLTMLLAGLAGGLTHCAGMCAPFVMAQASTGVGAGAGMVARLAGAALLPYQAGRMLGYGLLGAVAGASAGAISQVTGLRQVLAALLLLAALLMARQALARLPAGWRARLPWAGRGDPARPRPPAEPSLLMRSVARLLARPGGWNGVGLGLLLSGLPCGLLYAALAGAGATGSALAGGLAMLAFTLGTVPALVGVALLGRLFLRGRGPMTQAVGGVLFLVNAALLAAMAVRLAA